MHSIEKIPSDCTSINATLMMLPGDGINQGKQKKILTKLRQKSFVVISPDSLCVEAQIGIPKSKHFKETTFDWSTDSARWTKVK
jgi:hypothetical protein